MACATCNAATDLYHCAHCTDETRALAQSLTRGPGTTPGLLDELDVTVHRLDRITRPGDTRSRNSTTPLPINLAAAAARDHLTNTITTWTRVLLDAHPQLTTPSSARDAAVMLTDHAQSIACQPWAPDLLTDLHEAVDRATRAIDLPPSTLRIDCPRCHHTRVPILPGEVTACRTCTTDGTPDGARMWGVPAWWAEQVAPDGELIPLTLVPVVLPRYGWPVEARKARQWVEEGHVECLCTDLRGRRLVDPVDVAVVAARMAGRRRNVRRSA